MLLPNLCNQALFLWGARMNTAWPLSHFRNSSLNHSREIPFLKLWEFSFTNNYIYVICTELCQQNGGVDSFKPISFQRNIEKVPETQNLKTKVYNNQQNIKEKEKTESSVAFLFALGKTLSQFGSILKTAAHVFKCETLAPSSREREEDLTHKLLCLAQSKGHPEGITQGADLWFAYLGIYPGWKSIKYCLKKCYGFFFFFFNVQSPGAKFFSWNVQETAQNLGGKAREMFFVVGFFFLY